LLNFLLMVVFRNTAWTEQIFLSSHTSGGEPEKPLIIHVGRFGREKNLDLLKR
jgi:hypothetical protein